MASLRSCRLSGLSGSRSLLSGGVFFGETLLSGLRFPLIITDFPSVFDQTTAELPKHTSRRDDGYLSRAIRVRQDLLVDQIVLLCLIGNNLVQRPVFVE